MIHIIQVLKLEGALCNEGFHQACIRKIHYHRYVISTTCIPFFLQINIRFALHLHCAWYLLCSTENKPSKVITERITCIFLCSISHSATEGNTSLLSYSHSLWVWFWGISISVFSCSNYKEFPRSWNQELCEREELHVSNKFLNVWLHSPLIDHVFKFF